MPKVKRNRKIRTCEYCYHHKLKCDRKSPCSTCVRTKSECLYQFKNGTDSDSVSTEEYSNKSLKKSQFMPKGFTNKSPSNSQVTSPGKDNVITWKKENGHISIEEKDSNIIFSTNINNMPLYYSRAFFPYLEPSLNRMFLFKMSEIGERGTMGDFSNVGTYDFQRFGFKSSLEQLVKDYPDKEDFDDIIYIYWDYIHPLIPIIDKETTMVKYIKFWEDLLNKASPKFDIDTGVLFLAMLLAVKTAFQVNITDEEQLKKSQEKKNKIYDTFEKFKLFFGFKTNPNISYIQASIILYQSSAIYFIGLFTYTAALSRQAEFMGLHRDPVLHDVYPNRSNTKEIEIRRIVWHYVRYLDTATSGVSGMSPHMIMTNASTKFPSKRDYNPETGKFDGDINPFMVFTISRFKCSLVMETISHYLNSDFSNDVAKLLGWEGISRTVIALYQDVFILVKQILNCASNPKYSQNLLRFLVSNSITNVHRTYLFHRACDRRPYSHHNRVILKPANASNVELTKLSQANSSKDFFEKVLTIRMPYYESIMEVSILLLYESRYRLKLTPELEKFRWFSKNANPLQYTYFVLRDIYHYPEKRYDFSHIPQDIKNFIIDEEILNFEGDIRRNVVDVTIANLAILKDYWCEPISDVMNFLYELQKYVYKCIDKNTGSNKTDNVDPKRNFDTNTASVSAATSANSGTSNNVKNDNIGKDTLNEEFEFDKYKNIMDLLSTLTGEVDNTNAEMVSAPAESINISQNSSASDSNTPTILNNQPIPNVYLDNNKINFNTNHFADHMKGSFNSNHYTAPTPTPPLSSMPNTLPSMDMQRSQVSIQKPGLSATPSFDPSLYYSMSGNTPLITQNNIYGMQMYPSATTPSTQITMQQPHQMQPTAPASHMQSMPHIPQYQQLPTQQQYQHDPYNNQSLLQMHPNGMVPPHLQSNSSYIQQPHEANNITSQTNGTINNPFNNTNPASYGYPGASFES